MHHHQPAPTPVHQELPQAMDHSEIHEVHMFPLLGQDVHAAVGKLYTCVQLNSPSLNHTAWLHFL